jgi:hypothetical protein
VSVLGEGVAVTFVGGDKLFVLEEAQLAKEGGAGAVGVGQEIGGAKRSVWVLLTNRAEESQKAGKANGGIAAGGRGGRQRDAGLGLGVDSGECLHGRRIQQAGSGFLFRSASLFRFDKANRNKTRFPRHESNLYPVDTGQSHEGHFAIC